MKSGCRGRGRLGAVLVGLMLALSVPGCAEDPQLVPPQGPADQAPRSAVLQVAGRDVTVELAYTQPARNRGLMHRTSLEPDSGMLFLFTDTRPRTFWMRDTLIPLDIIFLTPEGEVLNVAQGRAGVERPGYNSRAPARFVLELEQGWAARAGLGPGDRIEISEDLRALAQH